MSGEQPAPLPPELAEIEGLASAADAQITQAALPPGTEPPPSPIDRGVEFGSMLQMGVMMLTPALPFLPQCYPPATCHAIGASFAAVAEKRGWQLDALTSPELALAVVAVPPTISAVVMGRAYFAARRAEAEAAERRREADAQPLHG